MVEALRDLIQPEKNKLPAMVVRQNVTYWERATFIFIIIMYLIFPFTIGPQRYNNITEMKYNFFRLFTLGYVLVILIMLLAYILEKKIYTARKNEGFEKIDLPQIICIIYFVSAAISGILSPYEDANLWIGNGRYEGLMAIMCYCLVFIFLSFWGEYSEYYFYAVSVAVTVFSILGILQTAGIQIFKYTPEGYGYSISHFVASLGNVDMVSGYTALTLALLAGFFIVYGGKINAIFTLVPYTLLIYLHHYIDVDSGRVGLLAAFMVAVPIFAVKKDQVVRMLMVLSATTFALFINFFMLVRGVNEVYTIKFEFTKKSAVFLAATVILALMSFVISKKKDEFKMSAKKIRIILVVLIAICIVAGLFVVYTYDGSNVLVSDFSKVLHGQFPDSIGSGRGYIWKNAVKTINEMPFFGSGPDTFIFRYMQYNKGGSITDFAHNDFIQIAVNQGLVGLALYLILIGVVAIRALKLVDKNPRTAILGLACLAYLVHSFFSFSIAIIAPYFWVTFGILNKCIRQTKTDTIGIIYNKKDEAKKTVTKGKKK